MPLMLPRARWALTPPFHPYHPKMAVSFLWHCSSQMALANCAQALPGSLSTGARTFLELSIAWILTRDRPTDCSLEYNNMTNSANCHYMVARRLTNI